MTGSSVSRRSIIGSVQGNKKLVHMYFVFAKVKRSTRQNNRRREKNCVSLPLVVSFLFLGHQNHSDPAQGKFWNHRDR